MDDKKTKIKNILILILIFTIGFGVGMIVTFETVFSRLPKYNIIK